MYECFMAESYSYYDRNTFILVGGEYRIGQQDGYRTLEFLEEHGVPFRWKPDGEIISQPLLAKYRKNQLVGACLPFINY